MAQPERYILSDGRTIRWKVRYRTADGRSTDKSGFATKREGLLWQAPHLVSGARARGRTQGRRSAPVQRKQHQQAPPTALLTDKLNSLYPGDRLTASEAAARIGTREDLLPELRLGNGYPLSVKLWGQHVVYLRQCVDKYIAERPDMGVHRAVSAVRTLGRSGLAHFEETPKRVERLIVQNPGDAAHIRSMTTPIPFDYESLLTETEAAERLDLSVERFIELTQDDTTAHFRMNDGARLYQRRVLDQWTRARSVSPSIMYSIDEVAFLCGTTTSAVRRWDRLQGAPRPQHRGNRGERVYYRARELTRWLDQLAAVTASARRTG